MRHAFLLLFIGCTLAGLSAQAPEGFNFQAVARDAAGEALAADNISVRMSLRRGSASGPLEYQERHLVTTTQLGVFDLAVGSGTTLFGDFSFVNWGGDNYWLQVELDPNGGTNYTNMGASQLLSVPYAMYAAQGGSDDQQLSLSGSILSLENGGSVNLSGLGDDTPWLESGNNIYYNDGRVGIGTSSPTAQMQLRSNSTVNSAQLRLEEIGNDFARIEFSNTAASSRFWHMAGYPSTNPASARLNLYYYNGSIGQDFFTISGTGNVGIYGGSPTARLELFQRGQTVGSGLRFDDGTANQDWDITHGFALRFHYGGDLRGFINATTGVYTVSSDRRLKGDVKAIGSVMDRVMTLRPTSYYYLSDEAKTPTIGFIAQETMEAFPEFVHYSAADELYGVDYAGFSVVAIRAIQEQQAVIDAQEQRIESLEARLARLETLLDE